MKPVLMFMMKTCPYCKQALQWMEELRSEDDRFKTIEVQMIDETLEPEMANQYDYYLVPTYYVNGQKLHEGVATKDIVRKVFEESLNA